MTDEMRFSRCKTCDAEIELLKGGWVHTGPTHLAEPADPRPSDEAHPSHCLCDSCVCGGCGNRYERCTCKKKRVPRSSEPMGELPYVKIFRTAGTGPTEPVGEVTPDEQRLLRLIITTDYEGCPQLLEKDILELLAAIRTRLERERDETEAAYEMEAQSHRRTCDDYRVREAKERAEAALAAEREHWKQIHTGCHAERDELEQVMLHEKAMRESLQAQLHGMQDGAALRDALTRITALEAERDRLRAALRWYADVKHWRNDHLSNYNDVDMDRGDKARKALTDRTEE